MKKELTSPTKKKVLQILNDLNNLRYEVENLDTLGWMLDTLDEVMDFLYDHANDFKPLKKSKKSK